MVNELIFAFFLTFFFYRSLSKDAVIIVDSMNYIKGKITELIKSWGFVIKNIKYCCKLKKKSHHKILSYRIRKK